MARSARVVVPGYPHHVTQRGCRRQPTFFHQSDYQLYLDLMADWCQRCGVEIWAYCLMPNHVHLVAVPSTAKGLSRAIGFAHRAYAVKINKREGWSGHLWQERFASFLMDETYLLAAVRYVLKNPVRASMVSQPEEYAWSSVQAHLVGQDDRLVKVEPMRERISCWKDFLTTSEAHLEEDLKRHAKNERPLGPSEFLAKIEKMLGRKLKR